MAFALTGKQIVPEIPSNVKAISTAPWNTVEIVDAKLKLVTCVCSTLIQEPRYYSTTDDARCRIVSSATQVATADPAFILKLAFYVREDLSIRSTANFLLALSAQLPETRPHLRKYFGACTRLPTDILEVVELYQELQRQAGKSANLPTVLRKALQEKLATFDEYQLAKYNHEASAKKKAAVSKKSKKPVKEMVPHHRRKRIHVNDSDSEQVEVADVQMEGADKPVAEKKKLTLKRLIRMIHASEPVNAVMCILGKKYPSTPEDFAKSGLKGDFDQARAGKRMRLKTPETWETQLSAKGNNAETWETLINHRKLPFMAGLRNIRNLLLAGISPKHHETIISRFENEESVARSRQFPYRFLAAFDVINALDPGAKRNEQITEFMELTGTTRSVAAYMLKRHSWSMQGASETFFESGAMVVPEGDTEEVLEPVMPKREERPVRMARPVRAAPRGRLAIRPARRLQGGARARAAFVEKPAVQKRRTPKVVKEVPNPPTASLLARYRQALDTAIRLAVVSNVAPLRGYTAVFCDVSGSMRHVKVNTAKGLGQSNTHPYEIAMLLGLMIHYVSEEGEIQVFGSRSKKHSVPHTPVVIPKESRGHVLQHMQTMREKADELGGGNEFFYDWFENLIETGKKVDRIVILSDVMIDSLDTRDRGYCKRSWTVPEVLAEYRAKVNPDFRFISVDLAGNGAALTKIGEGAHPNDINITGYSEKILQFLADSPQAQVLAVDAMDERLTTAAMQTEGPSTAEEQ